MLDLVHHLSVWSSGYLWSNSQTSSDRWLRHILNLMLCNLGIEYWIVELFRVLIDQIIPNFFIMGFNDVALAWWSIVWYSVITRSNILLEYFFVFYSSVLVFDKSLSGWWMFLIISTFTVVSVHNFVEAVGFSVVSSLIQLSHKPFKFILDGRSLVSHVLVLVLWSIMGSRSLLYFFGCYISKCFKYVFSWSFITVMAADIIIILSCFRFRVCYSLWNVWYYLWRLLHWLRGFLDDCWLLNLRFIGIRVETCHCLWWCSFLLLLSEYCLLVRLGNRFRNGLRYWLNFFNGFFLQMSWFRWSLLFKWRNSFSFLFSWGFGYFLWCFSWRSRSLQFCLRCWSYLFHRWGGCFSWLLHWRCWFLFRFFRWGFLSLLLYRWWWSLWFNLFLDIISANLRCWDSLSWNLFWFDF